MTDKFNSMNTRVRNTVPGLFAALVWLGAAALGGTFALGCSSPNDDGFAALPPIPNMLAIASGGQIKVYTGLLELALTGPAPTPAQTIIAPNVESVAFGTNGNLYFLANDGTLGSDATFFYCQMPPSGLPFPPCTAVGGPIVGGQWLAVNGSSVIFATSITATTGTIVSFPAAIGPPVVPTVVYTSGAKPFLYGGIAVDGSNSLYVTEQGSAPVLAHRLFKCTAACQAAPGTQGDLTGSITTPNPGSAPGGPLATSADGTTLFVGAANTGSAPIPLTLPVVFVCTQGAGGLTCQADSATFPAVNGTTNPFVTAAGVAADSTNNVYAAALLNDNGDTTTNLGPSFFGFVPAGAQFACSTTPATCRVNQLPSVGTNTEPGLVPYGLAVSHIP